MIFSHFQYNKDFDNMKGFFHGISQASRVKQGNILQSCTTIASNAQLVTFLLLESSLYKGNVVSFTSCCT